jgi:hypothetical protein
MRIQTRGDESGQMYSDQSGQMYTLTTTYSPATAAPRRPNLVGCTVPARDESGQMYSDQSGQMYSNQSGQMFTLTTTAAPRRPNLVPARLIPPPHAAHPHRLGPPQHLCPCRPSSQMPRYF